MIETELVHLVARNGTMAETHNPGRVFARNIDVIIGGATVVDTLVRGVFVMT
jgi:hypothetical protein